MQIELRQEFKAYVAFRESSNPHFDKLEISRDFFCTLIVLISEMWRLTVGTRDLTTTSMEWLSCFPLLRCWFSFLRREWHGSFLRNRAAIRSPWTLLVLDKPYTSSVWDPRLDGFEETGDGVTTNVSNRGTASKREHPPGQVIGWCCQRLIAKPLRTKSIVFLDGSNHEPDHKLNCDNEAGN